jgi:hypothetical protein
MGKVGSLVAGRSVRLRWIVAMSMSGCSWIFQEHETHYDDDHEPRCTDVSGWWLWDLANTAVSIADVVDESTASSPSAGRILVVGSAAVVAGRACLVLRSRRRRGAVLHDAKGSGGSPRLAGPPIAMNRFR